MKMEWNIFSKLEKHFLSINVILIYKNFEAKASFQKQTKQIKKYSNVRQ